MYNIFLKSKLYITFYTKNTYYSILELHGPSRALANLAATQGFASLRYATRTLFQ